LTAADDDRKLISAFELTKAADAATNEGEAPTTVLEKDWKGTKNVNNFCMRGRRGRMPRGPDRGRRLAD
jgi:hypothetical protein